MWKYLKYHFDRSLEKSFLSLVFFLFLVSTIGIVILSLVFYVLFLLNIVTVEGKFLTFLWSTFGYFIDVGTIAAEGYYDNSSWDKLLKIFITIFGVIIFSTFIGIISQAISDRVELLRSGNGPLYEKNHIVIFNFTRKLIPLLQELFQAFEDNNYKTSIVIVSDLLPRDAQNRVESYLDIPKKINLIFRTGYAWQKKIPNIVNLNEANQLIILKPDINEEFNNIEDCDIEVGKCITTLLESNQFNRTKTNVICEFFTKQKSELYRFYVSDILQEDRNINFAQSQNKILFIEVEDCRANLISQAVNTPDILEIYDEIFSYTGSEIYFIEFNKLDTVLRDKCLMFKNLKMKDLNAKLFNSICIGTFFQKDDFDQSDETEVKIQINPKNIFNFDEISGFIFIAHDLNEIYRDINEIEDTHKNQISLNNISYFDDKEVINPVIVADEVNFNRLKKIINRISDNEDIEIDKLKLIHDEYISNEEISNLNEEFKNQFEFFIKKIDFHELRNETRYPYKILKDLFEGYNKIICVYDNIVDDDDNINNIKDNKVVDTFKLFSFINKNDKTKINKNISFISEVGGFKTKQHLENNRKFYYNPFIGEDIIDLNTISSKIIASGVIDSRNVQLINSFLEKGQKVKSYTINNDLLETSFDELEFYFANKKNEILIGIIDYDLYENDKFYYKRKKINQIIVNPDQRKKIKLSNGDRLITII